MRLYHSRFPVLLLLMTMLVAACVSPQATQALITVSISADGQTKQILVPAGSTVQQSLDQADLELNALDRTEPPVFTVLGDEAQIRLVRVAEKFEVEQVLLPFEQQTLRNESMPRDQELLIQKGQNGLQEITYRRVYEDGVEISSQPIPVNAIIVRQPVPEIRMIGVQTPLTPISVPGRLFYLRDGNVWMIEGTTATRRPVLTTGDLDGRIFSISSDGAWLLLTRGSNQSEQINSLWVADVEKSLLAAAGEVVEDALIDVQVPNVIHFADWVPASNTKIVFSTVEPRQAPPGWQANNDLQALTYSTSGWTTKWTTIIEPNFGGVYGWWGTNYLWAPDGLRLAYARPDGIGIVNYKDGSQTPLMGITPLQTRRDWAWVPGLTWGPDGNTLFTVDHVFPPGSTAPEESQAFDLAAAFPSGGNPLHLVTQTGMFAYPLASPMMGQVAGAADYRVAFLQASFPDQSETSRYRLVVMDRDGSNRQTLFPEEGFPGLEPQRDWGAWSPAPMPESENYAIAVLFQGNLWFVDATTGDAIQITSDGLTTRVIWK